MVRSSGGEPLPGLSYAPSDALHLERVSRETGMLVTGGSDSHGEWHGRLGDYAV